MKSNFLIMSDIHGNLTALEAALQLAENEESPLGGLILLGDIIDYGPRSNEVIRRLQNLAALPVLVNIWGNHEKAIVKMDYSRFSAQRGSLCARNTRAELSDESVSYLEQIGPEGKKEFNLMGRKCLAVHGTLEDPFWTGLSWENAGEIYAQYDFVFSGHSHVPHCFCKYYPIDDSQHRNKKTTTFINPGSVGQPRNHNPRAQCAMVEMDTESVKLMAVEYDIEREMSHFSDRVDPFYRERLMKGI